MKMLSTGASARRGRRARRRGVLPEGKMHAPACERARAKGRSRRGSTELVAAVAGGRPGRAEYKIKFKLARDRRSAAAQPALRLGSCSSQLRSWRGRGGGESWEAGYYNRAPWRQSRAEQGQQVCQSPSVIVSARSSTSCAPLPLPPPRASSLATFHPLPFRTR